MKQRTVKLFVGNLPTDADDRPVRVEVTNDDGQVVSFPVTGIAFGRRGLVLKTDTRTPMENVTAADEDRSIIEGDGWSLHLSQRLKGAPTEVVEALARRLREVRA